MILNTAFKQFTFRRFGDKVDEYKWKPGYVYPAIFLTKREFDRLPHVIGQPTFFVMRDIRDTLVSLYFSHRYSHTALGYPEIAREREYLETLSEEEGILYVAKKHSHSIETIQRSWIEAGVELVRYEDLLESEGYLLHDVLRNIKFPYDEDDLNQAISAHSFEKSFGRKLGDVDNNSHGRQGLAGNWRNYAGPAFNQYMECKLRSIIELSGYER